MSPANILKNLLDVGSFSEAVTKWKILTGGLKNPNMKYTNC